MRVKCLAQEHNAMSPARPRGGRGRGFHYIVFSKNRVKHLNVIKVLERILFEVRPFLVELTYFADSCSNLACFNEIHQNVNDLVFRDKVE